MEELKQQNINKIIAVGHARIDIDKRIAKEVDGVDIVVGGHTNTFLYTGTIKSTVNPQERYNIAARKSEKQAAGNAQHVQILLQKVELLPATFGK